MDPDQIKPLDHGGEIKGLRSMLTRIFGSSPDVQREKESLDTKFLVKSLSSITNSVEVNLDSESELRTSINKLVDVIIETNSKGDLDHTLLKTLTQLVETNNQLLKVDPSDLKNINDYSDHSISNSISNNILDNINHQLTTLSPNYSIENNSIQEILEKYGDENSSILKIVQESMSSSNVKIDHYQSIVKDMVSNYRDLKAGLDTIVENSIKSNDSSDLIIKKIYDYVDDDQKIDSQESMRLLTVLRSIEKNTNPEGQMTNADRITRTRREHLDEDTNNTLHNMLTKLGNISNNDSVVGKIRQASDFESMGSSIAESMMDKASDYYQRRRSGDRGPSDTDHRTRTPTGGTRGRSSGRTPKPRGRFGSVGSAIGSAFKSSFGRLGAAGLGVGGLGFAGNALASGFSSPSSAMSMMSPESFSENMFGMKPVSNSEGLYKPEMRSTAVGEVTSPAVNDSHVPASDTNPKIKTGSASSTYDRNVRVMNSMPKGMNSLPISQMSDAALPDYRYKPSPTIPNHKPSANDSDIRTKAPKGAGKSVSRIGGRALGVIGTGLDVYNTYEDYNAAKSTSERKDAFSSGVGSLAGGIAGAEGGAMIGAGIGSIIPGAGTVVGGAIGGLLGGIGGSFAGSSLGQKIGNWWSDPQDYIPDEIKSDGVVSQLQYIDEVMLPQIKADLETEGSKLPVGYYDKMLEYRGKLVKDQLPSEVMSKIKTISDSNDSITKQMERIEQSYSSLKESSPDTYNSVVGSLPSKYNTQVTSNSSRSSSTSNNYSYNSMLSSMIGRSINQSPQHPASHLNYAAQASKPRSDYQESDVSSIVSSSVKKVTGENDDKATISGLIVPPRKQGQRLPRGIRNNNPGNLNYVGQSGASKEDNGSNSRFAKWKSPREGIVGMAKQLLLYHKRNIRTVPAIISKYAPPGENDTNAYISRVCKTMGVTPNDILDLRNDDVLSSLMGAIIPHENAGYTYRSDLLKSSAAAAISGVPVSSDESSNDIASRSVGGESPSSTGGTSTSKEGNYQATNAGSSLSSGMAVAGKPDPRSPDSPVEIKSELNTMAGIDKSISTESLSKTLTSRNSKFTDADKSSTHTGDSSSDGTNLTQEQIVSIDHLLDQGLSNPGILAMSTKIPLQDVKKYLSTRKDQPSRAYANGVVSLDYNEPSPKVASAYKDNKPTPDKSGDTVVLGGGGQTTKGMYQEKNRISDQSLLLASHL